MPARRLELSVLPGRFAVCRLAPSSPVPAWLPAHGFVSVTRTADELSIVCEESRVPAGVKMQAGWVGLALRGPVEFSEVGVLASLAEPLAKAGIGIFVISTFDTDYLLVAQENLDRAAAALTAAGHTIRS
ncbi:MAG TPA: ACT domain-containing protein [Candidatus Acidoferrales bacterium]|nr:ACT domain-containing protein [Candidatus Acidoferrales bacterium]